MMAAVLTQLNAPLEIHELTYSPLMFGQVLVKIHQSGICGAQIAEIRGEKGNAKFMPHLLGHEASGTVLKVGDGVRRVKPGNRVVCHWRKADGQEAEPATYFTYEDQVRIGSGPIATFAEEAVISENRLTPVPSDTPHDLCALLGCGLSTALGTIENEAKLQMGETVLIIGCGGLGANLILAAKLRQASYIGVVDVADKRALATALGASEFAQVPGEHLGRGVFDVVIDTTGSDFAFQNGIGALASGGRFVMVGQPRGNVLIPNARSLFDGEGKSIIATQGGQFKPEKDLARYISMWRSGILKIDGLITHRFPLNRINEGICLVKQGQAGRVMIDCQ